MKTAYELRQRLKTRNYFHLPPSPKGGRASSYEFLDVPLVHKTNTLVISTTGRIDIIDRNSLVRIEADSNYCRLFLESGRTLFVAKVLKKFEDELDTRHFIRPHKTHLVNKSFITSYIKGANASIVLSTGEQIPVARRKKALFN